MVRKGPGWKFQQLQFQYDMETSWALYLMSLLAMLFLASLIRLIFMIVRTSGRSLH